jgi:hypothetical protein
VLIETQKLLVSKRLKKLLFLNDFSLLTIVIPVYKLSRNSNMGKFFKNLLLPSEYKTEIKKLDIQVG